MTKWELFKHIQQRGGLNGNNLKIKANDYQPQRKVGQRDENRVHGKRNADDTHIRDVELQSYKDLKIIQGETNMAAQINT